MISKDIGIMEKKNIGANGFFFFKWCEKSISKKNRQHKKKYKQQSTKHTLKIE